MNLVKVGATVVIYRREHAYSSHPFITIARDGAWLLVFSHSIRQSVDVHPGSDPFFVDMVTRSTDQGATWELPRVAPSYDWYGVEVAGIATLSTGEVVLNQLRWKFAPTEEARRQWLAGDRSWYVSVPGWLGWGKSGDQDRDDWDQRAHHWVVASSEEDWANHRYPFARGEDGTYVHISDDDGRTWSRSSTIDCAPYISAYSRPGALELENGHLILAMQSHDHDPTGAVFVV
ncbi:MAG: sialidase family protein, partial [bacterium]